MLKNYKSSYLYKNYKVIFMDLKSFGWGVLKEVLSLGWGTGAGALKLFWNTLTGAAQQLMKFHEEGIAFARDMGMSLKEAQAYTKVLTTNTKKLAFEYGVTSETIMKIQRGLSEATSRQLFLNQVQTEHFVQLNKLAGESSVSKFAEEMMNGMGAQVDAVEGAIAKAYATATKSGLSAKKTTEMIASSLGMANKLSFRNGVDGLTKMAMQAQKIGMSLQSVESVAKTFMDFEGAIEHSAQLQMLGGAAGAFGGNPLDMMYEENYDPEALQKRMEKMLGGLATFDAKSGMSSVNGFNMDIARNIAKAMGIDESEAVRVAKKNAELGFKQRKFGNKFSNYSQEEQDFIMNKSYVKDGKLYINDAGGEAHEITNGSLDNDILKDLHKWDGKSDREIMEIQAKTLTTINEKIEGLIETIKGIFAEKFADYVPKIQEWIEKNGGKLVEKTMAAAAWIVKEGPGFVKNCIDYIKKIWNGAQEAWTYIKRYFPWFLAALGATALSKFGKGGKGGKAPAGATGKGGAGGKGGGGAKPNTSAIKKTVGKDGKTYYSQNGKRISADAAKTAKENGAIVKTTGKDGKTYYSQNGKRISADAAKKASTSSAGAASKASSTLSKVGKVAKVGGKFAKVGGLAAVIGGVEAWLAKGEYEEAERQIMLDESLDKEEKKKAIEEIRKRRNGAYGSAIGGVVGSLTALIPGVGAAVAIPASMGAAMLGDWIGTSTTGEVNDKELEELQQKYKGEKPKQSLAIGGPVVGSSIGAPVDIKAHAGEFVMSNEMVAGFKSFFTNPGLYAMPVGQNDFTYKPGNTEISKVGDSTITVKDFNINIGGTIRLDAGSSSANINMDELMRDPVFMNKMKGIIEDSVSKSYYGGRKMNDLPTKRGLFAQSGTIARRS